MILIVSQLVSKEGYTSWD